MLTHTTTDSRYRYDNWILTVEKNLIFDGNAPTDLQVHCEDYNFNTYNFLELPKKINVYEASHSILSAIDWTFGFCPRLL
ncbi:MAG: hypothetical protein CMC05_03745 [Flavobacteriaceae bacterium]|nr:hypothetical protein [Flavobacteriaceae bacterium]